MALERILVATDFGDAANQALDAAIALARPEDGQITLLHVLWVPAYYYATYTPGLPWPTTELAQRARQTFAATLEAARARYPHIDGVLREGEAPSLIVDVAQERKSDLIVVGTHGRRGLSRVLLGSVAAKVVRTSPLPVMVVPCPPANTARPDLTPPDPAPQPDSHPAASSQGGSS